MTKPIKYPKRFTVWLDTITHQRLTASAKKTRKNLSKFSREIIQEKLKGKK